MLVMRVYFEKPRTTVGWRGLVSDPNLDGTFAVNDGLVSRTQVTAGGRRTRSPDWM